MSHGDIRIGTLVQGSAGAGYIRQIVPHGFESFQLTFWQRIPEGLNLKTLAGEVAGALDEAAVTLSGSKPVISSLAVFGNPLQDKVCAESWKQCIDACALFECDLVAGFAGALAGEPVPDAMKQYKKVFGPLPKAWEMMFDILPADNVGLEWEPCHQMVSLIDPLPQLRQWADKVFHLHGKDATVNWDVLRTRGLRGGETVVHHRTPGFGDTNWTDVISILRMAGFKGSIDIEGWHDPVYRGELEMTGQVHGLKYLQQCRGGAFVANPKEARGG